MKIKDGFIIRKVGGQNVVAAVGKRSLEFNGIIRLNETGLFLWEQLKNDVDEAMLTAALLEEYDIDEACAKNDIAEFIKKLKEADLLA
ncbi:MAG: PqqD family protein [Huintestinicola sp.]